MARKGFTLIELLVVVAIIAVLVAILLPALNAAREAAKSAVCQSTLHQIAVAIATYTDDNDGYLPCIYYLANGISPYNHYTYQLRVQVGNNADVFCCPSGKARPLNPISDSFRNHPYPGVVADYGINTNFRYSRHYRVARLDQPWGFLADVETPPDWVEHWYRWVGQIRFTHNWDWGNYVSSSWKWTCILAKRHQGGPAVLFTDFHVEWQPFEYWFRNDPLFGTGEFPSP